MIPFLFLLIFILAFSNIALFFANAKLKAKNSDLDYDNAFLNDELDKLDRAASKAVLSDLDSLRAQIMKIDQKHASELAQVNLKHQNELEALKLKMSHERAMAKELYKRFVVARKWALYLNRKRNDLMMKSNENFTSEIN